ncbi:MAG: hypothetical protein AAFQ11_07175, partial [Pseudomonadota bacterium]
KQHVALACKRFTPFFRGPERRLWLTLCKKRRQIVAGHPFLFRLLRHVSTSTGIGGGKSAWLISGIVLRDK